MKTNINSIAWYKWIIIVSTLISSIAIFSSCNPDEEEEDPTFTSNFCFSAAKSTAPYDSITGGFEVTELNSDGVHEVDLGFTFEFCDTSFQTLYIADFYNYSAFTYVKSPDMISMNEYTVMPFGSLYFEQTWGEFPDSSEGIISKIMTKTTGLPGNKITTVEFRNFVYNHFDGPSQQPLSLQIKFYENGNKIVFHYGPNEVITDFSASNFADFTVGVSSNSTNGVYLTGNPDSPTISNSSLTKLSSWPEEGTVFTFE